MEMDRRVAERDYRGLAREHGWSEEHIARIESLQVPYSMLDEQLRRDASAERVLQLVDRYEEATFGALRIREARRFDDEKLADLFGSTPERLGDWDVITERYPYTFAQFRLQENVLIQVAEEAGVLLAVISRSIRSAFVGGVRLSVRFSSAARVRPSGRGRGLGMQVRSGEPACAPHTNADYWYFRSQNFGAREWMRRGDPGRLLDAPSREDDVPGIPVTVLHFLSKPYAGSGDGIRPGRPVDTSACIDLINRTHEGQDLFRPYSTDFFEYRMNDGGWGPKPRQWVPVYGWADFWVLEEGGRIVACAGMWDRGRHIRERWRHRETDEQQVHDATALLDFGFAAGREDAMARLVEYLLGRSQHLGRTYLLAPLQQLPEVADRLAYLEPVSETWSMQWELHRPAGNELSAELPITRPYVDLVYW